MADILPYLEVEKQTPSEMVTVPDLTGMATKEATALLKSLGLRLSVSGSGGVVIAQIPAGGQQVEAGSQVLGYLGEMTEQSSSSMGAVPWYVLDVRRAESLSRRRMI